jgi:general secretion pathway protein A
MRRMCRGRNLLRLQETPFSDSPDAKQLFASQAWTQVKARLQFLVEHHGAGLLTGEVGSGKSTAARSFVAALHPNLFQVIYLHWTPGSPFDLLRQLARELDLEPPHYCGDLVRQISQAIVRLNQIRARSSIPFSSAMSPTCCAIRRWSSCRCC